MTQLYMIASDYRAIADQLEEAGGEASEDTANLFASIGDALEVKANHVVRLIREFQTQAAAVKEEEERLVRLRKAKENAADRLKKYLLECLQFAGVPKLDVGIAKLSVQKAPRPVIAWDCATDIPEPFRRVKVELDGTAAFEAWKMGSLPSGFTVKQTTFLTIR